MTDWKTVRGDVKPATLDKATSSLVVYEHRNIKEIEVSDDPSDPSSTKRTMWEYDEREIPVDEYAAMQSPVTREIMQALSGLELQIAELG